MKKDKIKISTSFLFRALTISGFGQEEIQSIIDAVIKDKKIENIE